MNRIRVIYLTDLILVPAFVLSLYTGIELHIAGQGTNHETWHNWAIFHTIVSLLFMMLGILHIKSHWGWYKGLKTTDCKGKRRAVLLLSVVFLLVVISGLSLLFFIEGANSSVGLLHYKTSCIAGILGILHILKRKHFLYKGFVPHVLGKKKEQK